MTSLKSLIGSKNTNEVNEKIIPFDRTQKKLPKKLYSVCMMHSKLWKIPTSDNQGIEKQRCYPFGQSKPLFINDLSRFLIHKKTMLPQNAILAWQSTHSHTLFLFVNIKSNRLTALSEYKLFASDENENIYFLSVLNVCPGPIIWSNRKGVLHKSIFLHKSCLPCDIKCRTVNILCRIQITLLLY